MMPLLLILTVVAAANACRFPSSLWCSTEEIAKECKVYQQCKEFEWRENMQAPQVNFELYFESLCPDCQAFITGQLAPTYSKIGDIMNLTLVPYGNAREEKVGNKWKFQCQHGKEECVGNLLETCAIHTLGGNMKKVLPFIDCMESSQQSPMKAVKSCADKHKVDLDSILSCYNSSLGNQLEHEMALKTDALKPQHQYVPWVVLNGVHTEKIQNEAQDNLLKLICTTYTGPKPSACTESAEEKSRSVCFKTELS